MFQLMNKKMRNKKGFTLIELIVVIAILAILALVAIPRLSGFTNSAKVSANQNNLTTIQNMVRIYEADTGALPTALANLQTAKYIGVGGTFPAPRICTDATYGAASGLVFRMDTTTGIVSIGAAAAAGFLDLSAGASN